MKISINTSMSVREKSDRPKLQLHHGPIEIERKFLVANNDWRQSAVRGVSIRDGLIVRLWVSNLRLQTETGLSRRFILFSPKKGAHP
jgi:hypothetical protein